MIRLAFLAAGLLCLAACEPVRVARPAPSGETSSNGGGMAALGNVPVGSTNFPYAHR